ncbi:class I SAM-dependent methyltransferase [Chloroflexota bacterium]
MQNGEKDNKSELVTDQVRGWDLAARTEESAMTYEAYFGGKSWCREEFFESGGMDVRTSIAEFLRDTNFPPAGKRALDIGCGIGRVTAALADIFDEVYGVDFSDNMIETATALHKDKPNLHFAANNGLDLSLFDDNSFDFCLAYFVFIHIPRFEVIASYIREIDRVLKPGGLYMFNINTHKWVIKVFGKIPMHYRVRDLLSKIGLWDYMSKLETKNLAKALRVYYTSPKKLGEILESTTLETIRITSRSDEYTCYYGRKNPATRLY